MGNNNAAPLVLGVYPHLHPPWEQKYPSISRKSEGNRTPPNSVPFRSTHFQIASVPFRAGTERAGTERNLGTAGTRGIYMYLLFSTVGGRAQILRFWGLYRYWELSLELKSMFGIIFGIKIDVWDYLRN